MSGFDYNFCPFWFICSSLEEFCGFPFEQQVLSKQNAFFTKLIISLCFPLKYAKFAYFFKLLTSTHHCCLKKCPVRSHENSSCYRIVCFCELHSRWVFFFYSLQCFCFVSFSKCTILYCSYA